MDNPKQHPREMHPLDKSAQRATGQKGAPDVFAIIGALSGCIAILVSVWAAVLADRGSKDTSGSQMIAETYSTFYDLNKKQGEDPQVSHMFVAPDDYQPTAALVRQSVGKLDSAARAKYLLKEKAIAFYIFTAFEESFYQYKHATEVGDKTRAQFLKAVLDYFTGRLLRNPRLLYYWSSSGGNVCQYYENETREYYATEVSHNKLAPLIIPSDAIGPYVVMAK